MGKRWAIIVPVIALLGCPQNPVKAPTTPSRSNVPVATSGSPSASPGSSAAPSSTAPSLSPTASTPPLAGALVGQVKLPAGVLEGLPGIVANNGGSVLTLPANIVGNNGGNIISDNGASLVSKVKFTASGQALLAGARVRVMDAGGRAVNGPDGKALEAVTGADGRYAFTSAPAAGQNHLLKVELPAQRGELTAILPKNNGTPVDVDAVSTLATTYVLDQYVRAQADPVAVLDRLPADVEAKTRAAALAALGQDGVEVGGLSAVAVVEAVNELRARNAGLDAQLEEVRRILLLAGQPNGGVGRPATEVVFSEIEQLGIGPGGDLYILPPWDRRLYRVDAQGILRVAAGTGSENTASQEGKTADQADLGYLDQVILEPSGGMILLDHIGTLGRIHRVGPDGKLKELWRTSGTNVGSGGSPAMDAIALLPNNNVLALSRDLSGPSLFWELKPGQAPQKVGETTAFEASWISKMGFLPGKSRLVVNGWAMIQPNPQFPAFKADIPFFVSYPGLVSDATSFNTSHLGPRPMVDLGPEGIFLSDGGYYSPGLASDRPFSIERLKGDGTRERLLDTMPEGATDFYATAVTRDRDGRLYVASNKVVYRVEIGKAVRVAGGGKATSGGSATDLALEKPTSAVPIPGGGYYITDNAKLLKVGTDNKVTQVRDKDAGHLAFGSDGRLYNLLFKLSAVASDGSLEDIYAPSSIVSSQFMGLAAEPGGSFVVYMREGLPQRVKAGTNPVQFNMAPANIMGVALDPRDNSIYVSGSAGTWLAGFKEGKLYRVPAGGTTATLVASDERFCDVYQGGLAADAKGRVYGLHRPKLGDDPRLMRYDPATQAMTVIAGTGGRVFAGSGVDDSLKHPMRPVFNAAGDLVFVDSDHKQLRRIPASELAD